MVTKIYYRWYLRETNLKYIIMSKLKSKVAVITGGNSGIGFGIARELKNEGAVGGAIVGRNQETLDSSVAELGENFIGRNADVTNLADLERLFKETSKRFGKIDVVVANAGGAVSGAVFGSVADIGEATYDKTMDLNLKSVYFTVHKALPYMNDGGSIILIGSNAAHRAYPSFTLYGAAKAAVVHFAKRFSNDLNCSLISIFRKHFIQNRACGYDYKENYDHKQMLLQIKSKIIQQ